MTLILILTTVGLLELTLLGSDQMSDILAKTKALVEKIEKIGNSDEFVNLFVMADAHGWPYRGESWAHELDEVKKELEALQVDENRKLCEDGNHEHNAR